MTPEELEKLRGIALRAISPIKPADSNSQLGELFWKAERTKAGRNLPHYYLVYFLLVDLLGFPDWGRDEKVAWSVPIEFEATPFLISHRKFGVGVFCENADSQEDKAKRIVGLISKGVRAAEPFYRSLAQDAVSQSKINIKNRSAELFSRYEYLRDQFRKMLTKAQARKDEVVTEHNSTNGSTAYSFPAFRLRQEASWVGVAAIEAFFAWTEHVFVQIAIILGRVTTGDEIAKLIEEDWAAKFKKALDITDKDSKHFYDSLATLRRQIRNNMAHGFEKGGEAFDFHSSVGAVPVILGDRAGTSHFSLTGEAPFEEGDAISTIEDFIVHLWSGSRHAAWLYIQDACLPVILTLANDGTYEDAMQSDEDMGRFIYGLIRQMDNAENMDW
jgi:hypothetical protein